MSLLKLFLLFEIDYFNECNNELYSWCFLIKYPMTGNVSGKLEGKNMEEKGKNGEGRKKRECGRMRKRETGRTRKKEMEQIMNNEYYDVCIYQPSISRADCVQHVL